jgi:glycosyltransferase involved in cell wall biosynthesis
MASGLPVVATNDLTRQEIVGDAGILVDVANPSTYAQAIKKTLEKQWGTIPQDQASKFNWQRTTDLFEKVLTRL